MEATYMSINGWMNKEHTHNGILLIHKIKWNHAICNSMDGTQGPYANWNKSEKDKYYIGRFVCVYIKNISIKLSL